MDRSTEEASSSSTSLRERRTRSESVFTTMPGSTLREQAGASTRAPSSSTTQTRQTLAGAGSRRSRASACRCRAPCRRRGSSTLRRRGRLARRSRARPCAPARRAGSCPRQRPFPKTPSRPIADSIALDAVWPRPQIDASRMHWPTSAMRASSSPTVATRPAGDEACQRLLLAHRADAAGHALPAGLVAEEGRDAHQHPGQVDRVVEDEDDARAEGRAGGPRGLEA